MERRKFLFFLPMLALTPKVVARSFIDLGSGTSVINTWEEDTQIWADIMLKAYSPEAVARMFDRENVFYAAITRESPQIISTRDMRVPLTIIPGGRFEES